MNNGFYEFSRGRQETATTSSVFPYTGSAIITGSLEVIGTLLNGLSTVASGNFSHAEGFSTRALGDFSHAEGRETLATERGSHAEGYLTTASGQFSHAEGYNTIAVANYQHVQGQYNISSSVSSAFIIGNGTNDSNRSNLVFAAGNIVEITGSLNVSGSITGSLFGTASFAVSSSRAVTSSFAINSTSASFAISASWAPSQTINTGSFVTTSSFNSFTSSYNTGSFTGSFTGSLFGTSSWANNAISSSFAQTASYAVTASFATTTPTDAIPTSGSTNGVQSGGVFDALVLKSNTTVATTGVDIFFVTPQIYNTSSSPATANITNDLTGANLGVIQKIYHNHSVAPTVPGGWVLIGGEYKTSELNIIYGEWCGSSRVEYWVTQEV